jgi:hypothetical protein
LPIALGRLDQFVIEGGVNLGSKFFCCCHFALIFNRQF